MTGGKSNPITDVRLLEHKSYANSSGDTWDPAWADDGNLYFPGNDGSGFDKKASGNVFFSAAFGEDFRDLKCATSNPMKEYGGWAERGPDNATWKTSGCVSVDGILYFAAGRHVYGTDSRDPHRRQCVSKTSIVKSADHGATWTRSAGENYERPMFPGPRFSTPYFIHYGRDGIAPDGDNAGRCVYAISNNGFWCNGDNYILGRVERAKLPRLDGSDWEYYTGGDGELSENWGKDPDKAALIIDNPLKCGETGATYIPSLGRYLLAAWYYPGDPTVETDETRFAFYESPRPWGPWTFVREIISRPEGWYCPRVLSKWQRGGGDEVDAVLVTGGDYYEMASHYRFTVVPLKLKAGGKYPPPPAAPRPLVIDGNAVGEGIGKFLYKGRWAYDSSRAKALGGGEHFSSSEGDYFAVEWEGTCIKWYSSKENNMGIAAVSIDGGGETEVDLYTYCTEPQYSRLQFDSGEISRGRHVLKVRVTGRKAANSAGFAVWNDRVEIYGSPGLPGAGGEAKE